MNVPGGSVYWGGGGIVGEESLVVWEGLRLLCRVEADLVGERSGSASSKESRR